MVDDASHEEHEQNAPTTKSRFPYDDRPYHPEPSEPRPLERLFGRGQTEGTPMGLGVLSWVAVVAFILVAANWLVTKVMAIIG